MRLPSVLASQVLVLKEAGKVFLHAQPTDMRKGFDGLALFHKRLERGRFKRPTAKSWHPHRELTKEDLFTIVYNQGRRLLYVYLSQQIVSTKNWNEFIVRRIPPFH
jgi:hypothetical protein